MEEKKDNFGFWIKRLRDIGYVGMLFFGAAMVLTTASALPKKVEAHDAKFAEVEQQNRAQDVMISNFNVKLELVVQEMRYIKESTVKTENKLDELLRYQRRIIREEHNGQG